MSVPRKAYRSDLSDAQWNRIKRWLPTAARTGRPRADDREVINGILYVMWTGCRWEDLPHDIAASPKTCHRRLLEYQRRRVWQRILAELTKEAYGKGIINLKNCYHDASVIKSKRGRMTKSDTPENTGSKA
jgi:transposase